MNATERPGVGQAAVTRYLDLRPRPDATGGNVDAVTAREHYTREALSSAACAWAEADERAEPDAFVAMMAAVAAYRDARGLDGP